ncbi:hypothetical protein ACXXDK_00240 [Deinococcus sp. PESE-38]
MRQKIGRLHPSPRLPVAVRLLRFSSSVGPTVGSHVNQSFQVNERQEPRHFRVLEVVGVHQPGQGLVPRVLRQSAAQHARQQGRRLAPPFQRGHVLRHRQAGVEVEQRQVVRPQVGVQEPPRVGPLTAHPRR